MAAAAAARTRPPAVDPKQRLSCILCDKYQPGDGKLLHCSHIMCVGCLKDSITRDGSVRCLLCPDAPTKSRVSGVDLIKQLISCSQYLYPNESAEVSLKSDATSTGSGCAASTFSSADNGASSAAQSTLYCNACDENDVTIEASHQCVDCDGLPLCEKHAERHPKTRLNAGHHVTLCTSQERCLLHPRYDIIAFCRTCDDTLCPQCQHTSHGDHDVIDLRTAVEEKHSHLKRSCRESGLDAIMQAGVSEKGSSTLVPTKSGLLESVTKALGDIEVEAEAASVIINDTFDAIESLVSETRETCLRFVDRKLWKESKPLELARRRLALLEQKEATMRCLVVRTKCPDSNPVHEIRATRHVLENLKVLSSSRATIGDCFTHSPIQAHTSSLNEVSKALKGVISFGNAESSFASSMPVPSGERGRSMAESATAYGAGPGSLICDYAAGLFTSDVKLVSVPQSVLQDYRASFDPAVCSSTIQLSEDNHVATQTSSATGSGIHVASTHGFSSGCHSWKVEFLRGEIASRSGSSRYFAEIGVATLPLVIDRDDSEEYYGETSYAWTSDGRAYKDGKRHANADLSACTDGDVLALTLDFNTRTFKCCNTATGEVRTMWTTYCFEKLYPAAYLSRAGMKVAYR